MSAPVNPQVIGEHIRRLRSDRGLSVRAFAAQTGFSPSFISQLGNGGRGDAVTLPAHAPRLWQNRTQEIAEILIVASRMLN